MLRYIGEFKMITKSFSMSSDLIAKVVGTVGSPLIVISELIKNAVDASATQIDVFYNIETNRIVINNNHKGFSLKEIDDLFQPGKSKKKQGDYLKNENKMFLTGNKGLGLLSVFLLCNNAEIETVIENNKICIIKMEKNSGTVGYEVLQRTEKRKYTKVVLLDVNPDTIKFLQSESEIKKLRHICTYLYKHDKITFPKIYLHVGTQAPKEINFACDLPAMLYDVRFNFNKNNKQLMFQCISPQKPINSKEVFFDDYSLSSLEKVMLTSYGIKETIPTRVNDLDYIDAEGLPDFEGRLLVYEKNMAGEQLKTYGAGVNIYINDFALYNYLAEENDWLGLADYSQRKKATRLKPHNVFGYVNFPEFNEMEETLQISNERADFIQDLTFQKLMFIIKGVVLFAILNIDVADKNPKYKVQDDNSQNETSIGENTNSNSNTSNGDKQQGKATENASKKDNRSKQEEGGEYSPLSSYSPKPNIKKRLEFSQSEGKMIDLLKGKDNLGEKIYNLVYELSKLDLENHRYAVACLYRALIESVTNKAIKDNIIGHSQSNNNLEESVVAVLNYFSNHCGNKGVLSDKIVKNCRNTVTKQKIIDILNEYIHNDTAPDAFKILESWNTMKSYIIMCLTKLK